MLGRSSSRSRTGCLFAGCGSLALGGVCQCQRRRPPVAHTLGPAGTGPRKSHLHGVSVVVVVGVPHGTPARRAGDARGGMGQEGCAGRVPPPPPPPPQSGPPTQPWGEPPSSCGSSPVSPAPGELLPAPRPPGGAPAALPTRVRPRNPHNYGGPVAPLNLVVDLKSVLRPPLGK